MSDLSNLSNEELMRIAKINPKIKEKIDKVYKLKSHKEIAKELNDELEKKAKEIIVEEKIIKTEVKEETLIINKEFKVLNAITERTIQSAEAFGLGIDSEQVFTIYKDCQLKYKQGDIIYITGDSGSGKSWILKNIFGGLVNSVCIEDIKIDDEEVVIEGVGKNISDALAKLNVAGLGDAFLYLRKYNQLSDGQKYRYKIAKFIDNEDKDIWILDEFCATLDRTTAKVISYNLQKIARKLGKTVVCATTHEDLLECIRPTTHIVKGYESDIVITYYNHSNWKGKQLEFYKDIKVEKGEIEDYEKLKRFHYRQAHLGARKAIYKMTYKDNLIGVIAICYPHLALKGRNIALNNELSRMTKENCKKLNDEFDSIARIIIHPKFRGIGLAQYFLQEYFKLTTATYVETVAVMANYNPFFERAGMDRIDIDVDDAREDAVRELEQFGFDMKLFSSMRYVKGIFDKLTEGDKNKVRDLVINIINRYKGASHIVFAKINKNPSWKEDLKANDELLFEYFKQLRRSNTVYLIKKLK